MRANVEIFMEFYTTFQFHKLTNFNLQTPNLIFFLLLGERFYFSIAQFNDALGFSEFENEHPYCDFCDDFDLITL